MIKYLSIIACNYHQVIFNTEEILLNIFFHALMTSWRIIQCFNQLITMPLGISLFKTFFFQIPESCKLAGTLHPARVLQERERIWSGSIPGTSQIEVGIDHKRPDQMKFILRNSSVLGDAVACGMQFYWEIA